VNLFVLSRWSGRNDLDSAPNNNVRIPLAVESRLALSIQDPADLRDDGLDPYGHATEV
jgi:hypothetical protein